jgi:hypothetical protein
VVVSEQLRESFQGHTVISIQGGPSVANIDTLAMKPVNVSYEHSAGVMACLLLPEVRVHSDKLKTMLIRVKGEVTNESLVALYQTSLGYPTASSSIVDFSAVTECSVSCDFIRQSAHHLATRADSNSLLLIVAPQPHVYGLCRMFQTLAEGAAPLFLIVHTLEEAFAAIGSELLYLEPLAFPA